MKNAVPCQRVLTLACLLIGLMQTAGRARETTGAHLADPSEPSDRAILKANNDTVSGTTIRNSCDGVVHPRIAHPTPGIALIVETDPTGMCVGSNPPSTMTVFSEAGAAWRIITSTPASTFRIGAPHQGRPDIVLGYPPFYHDCPVLRWDGRTYALTQFCPQGTTR